ncbi:MAG: AAA family ATPase [Desulfobacterales bacterium]|nr:AAA family ATPase [Desulfobacterales bacterium]
MKPIKIHIRKFNLDPNNYRFIDKPEYNKVSEEKITDLQIQKRTRFLLTGRNNELIQDLIISFKENGFLPVNQIQVKEIYAEKEDEIKYLVLEGNRRIATLIHLYEEYEEKGSSVGKLTDSFFRSVPVVLHPGENHKEHLIVMGLDHITGKRKWSPINQAQLIEDLINEHNMTEDEICNSLGISKITLRRTRRTHSLIARYRMSDFGDQFVGSMYSIFEEIIKSPKIKDWLGWDDSEMCSSVLSNEERIFFWISRDEVIGRDDDSGDEISREIKEPIITKAFEIRDLAKYIDEPEATEHMETTRSITEGFILSDAVGESKFLNALGKLKNDVSTVFNFSEYMQPEHLEDIQKLRGKIDRLLPANHYISPYTGLAPVFQEELSGFFTEIEIKKYRILSQLTITHLNRINIFAGKNNAGKTSLLEAVYLLSQLNDINAFLELERYRGKFGETFNPKWLSRNVNEDLKISGKVNDGSEVLLSLKPQQTDEQIDKSGYISSFHIEADISGIALVSNTHIFANKSPEIFYQKNRILCHAAMTNPYRYNEGLLKKAHSVAVKERFIDDIISFIRDNVDSSLVRIEMVNIEGESRFYAHSESFADSFDITKYGEGIQRVFEIALLTGYCRNGILCIDEFESAIHKSLLVDFSKFVHQLSERFNVQIFLTTHSKECIDAFIENQYNNDNITAFALKEDENNTIVCKYVEGTRLERLLDSIDIDIRG